MNIRICPYTDYNESEILKLYNSVGWAAYTREPELLRRAFENSILTIAAYDGDNLVGIIRAVGDGCTIIFIQDLLVHPEYQRKGIGSSLLKEVLSHYAHVRQIQLTTDDSPETIAFYRSQGFIPHSEIGCCGFFAVKRKG